MGPPRELRDRPAGGSGDTFFYDAFELVVMAPTHSAGDCTPKMDPRTGITFKACLDPVEVFAFVL